MIYKYCMILILCLVLTSCENGNFKSAELISQATSEKERCSQRLLRQLYLSSTNMPRDTMTEFAANIPEMCSDAK